MEITFVFPSSPFLIDQGVFPPLGILYLSAILEERGVATFCRDLGLGMSKEVETKIVGISLLTAHKKEGLELIKYYKERGHFVIVGGPHATHEDKDCYQVGADLVIRGYELCSFLERFDITLGESELQFFNDFPIPNRKALPITKYEYFIDGKKATPLMTTRGCFGSCSFCGRIPAKMELRTPENVIREIDSIHKDYGYEAFMVFDDVFTVSRNRLKRLVDRYEGSGFLFRCFSRTDLITDQVCRDLKRLGVVEVGLGVESGSEVILGLNMKGTSRALNTKAVKLLQKHNIRAKTFLIVGLPGESKETIEETINWIEEVKPDDLDISIFKPMPGSPIYSNPEKFGIIISKDDTFWYKGSPAKYETKIGTKDLSAEDLLFYRNLLEEKYKIWK